MSAKERKALGRGFSALLKPADEGLSPQGQSGSKKEGGKDGGVSQIEIDQIRLNPKQPRQHFDEEKLEELAQSIRVKGVIQPILLRRIQEGEEEHLELVAGERRLRASKLAGFDKIPAVIREIKDKDLLEVALIENIQRDDLNPIEEALAYQNLLKEHGYTQEDLGKRVGRNRTTLTNSLRLLQLKEEIQKDIAKGKISPGHGRCILSLEQPGDQLLLRDMILARDLSVRETEKWVKKLSDEANAQPKAPVKIDPQTRQNQERLEGVFRTKVIIKGAGKKGKIEIDYHDEADFNRIFSLLNQIPK